MYEALAAHAAQAGTTTKSTVGKVERADSVTLDSNAGKGALLDA